MVGRRARPGLIQFLLPVVAVSVVVSLLLLLYVDESADDPGFDRDLCPADTSLISASATLLLDFQKPLQPQFLPGDLLHELTFEFTADTELRVFALTDNADVPTRPVGRLCKPYSNKDLSVETAKDQRQAFRDCDDLPAQLAPGLRKLAGRFCTRRTNLESRVNALAESGVVHPVANAYLVEALNDTIQDLAGRPGTPALYVFSDMLQHAERYSQLELGLGGWGLEDLATLDEASEKLRRAILPTSLNVKIFYIPRVGLTEPPRAKRVHQDFWRAYFEGAEMEFEDLPPLPDYAVVPLMNLPARAESAAREREALQLQRQDAERRLAAVAQKIAALKRHRERAAIEERKRAERALELHRGGGARKAEQQPRHEGEQPRREEEVLRAAEIFEREPSPLETPDYASDQPELVVDRAVEVGVLSRSTGLAPCELTLRPPFVDLLVGSRYPGNRRVNYGAAAITVVYTVDKKGATVDDEVILTEVSNATDSRNFDALAEDTLDVVKSWEFSFEPSGEEACAKRQRRSATFNYIKKCRGAPMPSCQTIASDIEYL